MREKKIDKKFPGAVEAPETAGVPGTAETAETSGAPEVTGSPETAGTAAASESDIRITKEQQAAIEAAPGNTLVSAAAGSGKTFVMTKRLISRLASGALSLDSCLVLTFTKAAGESMEKKIRKGLEEELSRSRKQLEAAEQVKDEAMFAEAEKKVKILSEQTLQLQRAHISTIDAFCLWLIQNFPQEVQDAHGEPLLEAEFRTLDEKACEDLKERALSDVLAEAYERAENKEAGTEAFLALLDHYSDTKSDRKLRELILQVHDYLRSLPHYRDKVHEQLEDLHKNARNLAASPHMRYLLREIRLRLNLALEAVPELRARLDENIIRFVKKDDGNREYYQMFYGWFMAAEKADQILSAWNEAEPFTGWDALLGTAASLYWKKPRANSRAKDMDEELLKLEFTDDFMAAFADFMGCFGIAGGALDDHLLFPSFPILLEPLATAEAALQRTEPLIICLFDLVLKMDERYQELKRQKHGVDFSDHEHFALRVLDSDEGLAFCREQFKEVYIDEYQDTSSIQEAILSRICPDNLFMVGDVKQSIYRFRHAKPENFLQKSKDYEAGRGGKYLSLSRNFRSQAGILQAVNEIFCRLMTEDFSGIDYLGAGGGSGHAMVPGRKMAVLPKRTEIWLQQYEKEQSDLNALLSEEERDRLFARLAGRVTAAGAYKLLEADRRERMLYWVGREILRLHREEEVPFKDIAVMARGNKPADEAARMFTLMGIPQNRQRPAVVGESYTLQLQLALMQTLDNVRRDIPLATVLLSELAPLSFTESELVKLRVMQRKNKEKGSLFDALKRIVETKEAAAEEAEAAGAAEAAAGPENADEKSLLAAKARYFLERLEAWRLREAHLSVKLLLNEIWDETNYRAKLLRDEGTKGLAELESFVAQLSELEQNGRAGLHSVLSYFEDEMEKYDPSSPEKSENDFDGEGVNIVTYHKSKGLEYPYVFLLNLSARLQDKDTYRHIILSEDLGPGFDNIGLYSPEDEAAGKEHHYVYPSLLRKAMETEKQQRYLTEEICLLYVAMTRAEEKLYLCCDQEYKDGTADNSRLVFLQNEAGKGFSPALPAHVLQAVQSYQDMILLGISLLPYPPVRQLLSNLCMDESSAGNAAAISRKQEEFSVRVKQAADWAQQPREEGKTEAELMKIKEERLAVLAEDLAWSLRCFDDLDDYREALGEALSERRSGEEALSERPAQAENVIQIKGDLKDFYRFKADFPALPKQTVSEIKRQSQLAENLDEEESGQINLNIRPLKELLEPQQKEKMTAAEQGIALHETLHFLELQAFSADEEKSKAEAEVRSQLRRLQEADFLEEKQIKAVEPFVPVIAAYALSETASRVRRAEKQQRAFRELPFTFRYEEKGKESLVQGMIDLWYEEGGKVHLIDYKSDRLPEDREEALQRLKERYLIQMKLYALALEAGTGKELSEAVIWSIRRGEGFVLSRAELGLEEKK